MLWEQDQDTPIDDRGKNSYSNINFQNIQSYSPELWHYGIKGMHWGEITKGYVKVGRKVKAEASTAAQKTSSMVKEASSKIANLQSLRKQMKERRRARRERIIRFGNQVITLTNPKVANKKIADKGAAVIERHAPKATKQYITQKDYSEVLERILNKKRMKNKDLREYSESKVRG